jgi:acetoin utilization deacetylase AcuC-like enzyme
VLHPDCALHDPGWGHPEHQGRLPAIVSALEKATPELLDLVLQLEASPAAEALLALCHEAEMVSAVRDAVALAAESGTQVALDGDTLISAASWDAALAAVGSAVDAVELVLAGTVASAFALTRPPGHHATAARSMGFCLFNNVAVAARRAQELGAHRVLIVDWDVHHGNGTQDIFWLDPDVFYVSLHQSPLYPGTGSVGERGEGAGEGTTLNRPLPAGTGAAIYLPVFEEAVTTAVRAHAPDLILLSAGFDLLAGDPVGGTSLEPDDMHDLTRCVLEVAGRDVPVVAVLEGGYNPPRTAAGVVEVFRALAGAPRRPD